jgi:hypothetical protein
MNRRRENEVIANAPSGKSHKRGRSLSSALFAASHTIDQFIIVARQSSKIGMS